MKVSAILLSGLFILAACNSNPKVKGVTSEAPAVAPVTPKKTTTTTTSTQMTSQSDNTAKEKEGWSKTAKGAVIGGVVGAGTGAVINKKNRVAGAVVGGVVGAGTGAIIGNELDKKDGRH